MPCVSGCQAFRLSSLWMRGLRGELHALLCTLAKCTSEALLFTLLLHTQVATIDGFQGREMEVIVLCCVRANAKGTLGFLADPRRMNVALTRAKRGLVVIGNVHAFTQRQSKWHSFTEWAVNSKVVLPLLKLGS